eukprot:SAG31_NODE_197_length_20660_cov_8.861368_9_plen_75_part_00
METTGARVCAAAMCCSLVPVDVFWRPCGSITIDRTVHRIVYGGFLSKFAEVGLPATRLMVAFRASDEASLRVVK